jgi:outer membrane protein, heavy metal efflux system
MQGINRFAWLLPACLLTAAAYAAAAEFADKPAYAVAHEDPLSKDAQLSLAQLVDQTLEKYPDTATIAALEQEAEALRRKGASWLAHSPYLLVNYIEDAVGSNDGLREMVGGVGLPLWRWGQRDAALKVAERAGEASNTHAKSVKLEVAGLVRESLWNIALADLRLEQAQHDLNLAEQLLAKVKRRVELGDLARSDLLLAESNVLEMRSLQVQAQAEVMHSRKRYASLTQITRIPGDFDEKLSALTSVSQEHPALNAINSIIARKRSEVEKIQAGGGGQPFIELGGKVAHGFTQEPYNKSMVMNLIVPLGGSDYIAPQVAAANVEMTQALVTRDHLMRDLERRFHEAEHALEVDKAELAIANDLKDIAEKHLHMSEISFSAGETSLLDLLKIQSNTNAARRHAKERALTLQRDIAFYNQAVGLLP